MARSGVTKSRKRKRERGRESALGGDANAARRARESLIASITKGRVHRVEISISIVSRFRAGVWLGQAEQENVAEETSAVGDRRRRAEVDGGKRRSSADADGPEGASKQSWGSHPLALLGRSHSEPVGDCRVAINAVELTPGCPFAGKVRLKERRNGRQLPRSERASERTRARELVRTRGMDASMSITLAAPQSPLFCCSLCLPLDVAGLRVALVVVVVDVNDVFISDGYTRSDNENFLSRRYNL